MKRTIKEQRQRSLLFSLLAFVLVFSAVVPSSAVASSARTITVDSATKYTTVHSLNETGFEFTLKLQDDKKWANDVIDKEQLMVDGIQANQEVAKWEEYKRNHAIHIKKRSASPASDIFTNANRTELTLVFPQDAYYDLTSNQSMAIAINAALIEEWPGQVSPVNFMIYAKPQIALGGSITTDTTLGDIEIGGKVIELRLLNAQWNEEYLTRITNFNTLLDSFRDTEMPSGVWDVARALKNTDPNQVISYSEDKRTLKLTLPPVANTVTENITVTVPREFYSIEKVDVNGVLSVSGTEIPGNKISSTAVEIHIGSAAIPAMEPIEDLEESHLRTSHVPFHPLSTLTFKLKNAEWAVFTKEKKQLLLDSIQASDQQDQWELIKQNISPDRDIRVSGATVMVSVPTVTNVHLTHDMSLMLTIPYQLLKNDVAVPEQPFSIKAQPKVLLSGTALPSMAQTDFATGGKSIVLTLVNGEWQPDIATNTVKRENLLKAFDWNGTVLNEILARADVLRTNDQTVTITLPSIPGKYSRTIKFTSRLLVSKNLMNTDRDFLRNEQTFDVVAATNQSAVITGTATSKVYDFDIAKGGKSVIISLKNDTWISNLESIVESRSIQLKTVNGKKIEYDVIRTDDTTATLTLKPSRGFTVDEDQLVNITIPEEVLMIRTISPLQLDAAFKIATVSGTLTGTGISLDAADVQKGGKTLVITLANAEFKDLLSVEEVKSMFKSTAPIPWKFATTDFTVVKNKLTIKLPATPEYSVINTQVFEVVFNTNILKDYSDITPVITKKVENEKVTIGGTAYAVIEQPVLTESGIHSGTVSLKIKLLNASWDETITTNASKKSALLKNFTVTDQTKEWGIASAAIAKEGKFSVAGNTLTIQLPKNPEYSIVRDQNVTITIPKTSLKNYKYDVQVNQNLMIIVPTIQSTTSFAEVLESGLIQYINQNGLNTIRVEVPKKYIQKISTYAAQFGDNTFTTIEVEADDIVGKAEVSILSDAGKESKVLTTKSNNKYIFIFADVQPNSTLQVDVFNTSGELVESSFNKLAKGNKVFSDVPKSPMEGSYSLYSLLTDKTLLSNIFKYYSLEDLKIGTLR